MKKHVLRGRLVTVLVLDYVALDLDRFLRRFFSIKHLQFHWTYNIQFTHVEHIVVFQIPHHVSTVYGCTVTADWCQPPILLPTSPSWQMLTGQLQPACLLICYWLKLWPLPSMLGMLPSMRPLSGNCCCNTSSCAARPTGKCCHQTLLALHMYHALFCSLLSQYARHQEASQLQLLLQHLKLCCQAYRQVLPSDPASSVCGLSL